jgi:hypothetical protein
MGNKDRSAMLLPRPGWKAPPPFMMEAIFTALLRRDSSGHHTPMVRALGEEPSRKESSQTQLRQLISEEIADAICFMISNTAVSGSLPMQAGIRGLVSVSRYRSKAYLDQSGDRPPPLSPRPKARARSKVLATRQRLGAATSLRSHLVTTCKGSDDA